MKKNKKILKLDKWFAVQLAEYVLCGEVRTKYGPKVVYTRAIWGLKGNLAVCRGGIDKDGNYTSEVYKLGKVDPVWIRSDEADAIDDYELND
jgi:hypothetical protein